jgi:hypothetical protein
MRDTVTEMVTPTDMLGPVVTTVLLLGEFRRRAVRLEEKWGDADEAL